MNVPLAISIHTKLRGVLLPPAPCANASAKYEKFNRPAILPLPTFQSPDQWSPAAIFALLGTDCAKYTSSAQLLMTVIFSIVMGTATQADAKTSCLTEIIGDK
jgi:hypothetical protein